MVKFLAITAFHFTTSAFSLIKKILLIFFVFATVISLFFYFIQKDKSSFKPNDISKQNRDRIYQQIAQLEKDQSSHGQMSLFLYKGTMCSLSGEACTDNPDDGDINAQQSLMGRISGLIVVPYAHPPASSIVWINTSLQNAGFIPDTYAATGLGFASIHGYMHIWKLFRDIAYLLLVLVMIAIGFMIMFRVNQGQSVVGIENALPRIIIAMIMITFSFPIAGLLIDLMYVLIIISVGLLYQVGIEQYSGYTLKEYLNNYLTAGFSELWPDGGGSFFSVGIDIWRLIPGELQLMLHSLIAVPVAGTVARTFISPMDHFLDSFKGIGAASFNLGHLPGLIKWPILLPILIILFLWGPGLIIGLIVVLTVLLFIFRIFFMLLESYIKIIFYILFSPIILMFSAFPGNGNISWWLKNMIGELATFPTIIIITLAGKAVMSVNATSGFLGIENTGVGGIRAPFSNVWMQPEGQVFELPFLYGFTPETFNTIIALGLVLAIPDFVKTVKGWIGVSESPIKIGLGTFFAGAGIFTGGLGLGTQFSGFKQGALGYQPDRGWLDAIAPGIAENLRNRFKR